MINEEKIANHFLAIMKEIGLNTDDDSLIDTPKRVAKMYSRELFYGLNPDNFPKITVQENKFNYDQMLVESNITVKSLCEHHFVPIIGACHLAYIPSKKIIGLSKFNRIVDYFSRRPQVQERLTNDILVCLKEALETDNVAVVIDAVHMCVKLRGIEHNSTITRTSAISGVFKSSDARLEFFNSIPKPNNLHDVI